jgi:cytochrome c oxidase cbb3-type subunit IV
MNDLYTSLSQFALSWAMAGMALFFVFAVLWVFLPGKSRTYEDAARSIFRNDSKPGAEHPASGDGQGA